MKEILLAEIRIHPDLQVNDLYKFIHQAAFGSEHAVKDTAFVRAWMNEEIAGLDTISKDLLMDRISPDGRLVRVNLRPWLAAGYDSELLLQAFIKTANNFSGSDEKFKNYWIEAEYLSKQGLFSFGIKQMKKLYLEKEKEGFPAIHHSGIYEQKYKPAYRVIYLNYLSGF